ncbi:hypothetical protein Hdeb2414_s0001g00010701 [Helianthus debilis subsp. tardiflorus]
MSNQSNKNGEKGAECKQCNELEGKPLQILLEELETEISKGDVTKISKLYVQAMGKFQEKYPESASKRSKFDSEIVALEKEVDEIEKEMRELEREFNELTSASLTRDSA